MPCRKGQQFCELFLNHKDCLLLHLMQKMKPLFRLALVIPLFIQVSCDSKTSGNQDPNPSMVLWYDQPADNWTEALPLGKWTTGCHGLWRNSCMKSFNLMKRPLWTGQPHDYAHEGAYEVLDEMRQLLWDGKQDEAQKLGNERFMSQPFGQLSYQPFGNVRLHFPGHEDAVNYKRLLSLEDAISSVSYDVGDLKFMREVFASEPDQAIMVHLKLLKRAALEFTVGLDSPHSSYDVTVEGDELILRGKANNYPKFPGSGGKPLSGKHTKFRSAIKSAY